MKQSSDLQNEVKIWLESVLEKEHLKNLSVNILGNSEKGDGYLGDIIFVQVFGISESQSTQEYNLVLKCSKKSEALRSQGFVQAIFINEIYLYEHIIPSFNRFQKEKGMEHSFDSVPKFYGKYVDESTEIIVFENLKKIGYDLWDKRIPLTRNHIEMVLSKYAEFHAVSIAMQDQEPERFQVLVEPLETFMSKLKENNQSMEETYQAFESSVEEVYDVLKNDIDEEALLKWRNLKEHIRDIFNTDDPECKAKVILHGDCWNNNFMYLCQNGDKNIPKKVAILDWQMTKFLSPIYDLSYFLFTCISEDDLKDLDNVLKYYYSYFSGHIEKLGSCPSKLYPFEEFRGDWKKYCKFGILISSLIHKICCTDKDEVIDIADTAEQGKGLAANFGYEIKNKDNFKKRIRPIVEYFGKYELI